MSIFIINKWYSHTSMYKFDKALSIGGKMIVMRETVSAKLARLKIPCWNIVLLMGRLPLNLIPLV